MFGFESASRKEYSVSVSGKPRVESGMTITAYLGQADNWQTLIGWRDHESGEIICEPEAEPLIVCAGSFAALCVTGLGVRNASLALRLVLVLEVALFASAVQSAPGLVLFVSVLDAEIHLLHARTLACLSNGFGPLEGPSVPATFKFAPRLFAAIHEHWARIVGSGHARTIDKINRLGASTSGATELRELAQKALDASSLGPMHEPSHEQIDWAVFSPDTRDWHFGANQARLRPLH